MIIREKATTIGTPTKTYFLKGPEEHKMTQDFEAQGLQNILTLSGPLVTGNVINGNVAGQPIAPVTFSGNSDDTLAAVAAAIAAMPGVYSATPVEVGTAHSNDNRVINVIAKNDYEGVGLDSFVITGGASQATFSITNSNQNIFPGMQVMLNTDGTIKQWDGADNSAILGTALTKGSAGQMVTIAMRCYTILFAIANEAFTPGPVKYVGYDSATGYTKYTSVSVTDSNQNGIALDAAAGNGDIVRVAVR
jgi:hypothetical protein